MHILIVAATGTELKGVSALLKKNTELSKFHFRYTYNLLTIDTLVAGVGMIPTVYNLLTTIKRYSYDLILNIGIAGGFKNKCTIGDVLNVTMDQFSELGAEDGGNFISIENLGLTTLSEFPFANGLLINNNTPISNTLKKATGITVNTIHGNSASIENVVQLYNPDVETMEGAAFMYVCMQESIPFAQIRSISNIVEPRNKDNWNIALALKTLTDAVFNEIQIFEKVC